MADKFDLKAIISAVDKITPTLKGIQRSVRLTGKTIKDIGRSSGELLSKIGLSSAALGGGLAFAVKKVVDVSAEFEKYRTILETIEGSSEKARQSMDWVQDFAVKTPFELAQVTDAFVKLKAYGIDPQKGALDAAGNAAAAMGKDVMQAVETLADAMTGENERLKEFGIKASKQGDEIVYTWTENGKTMAARAKASSKEQIEATIKGIWNRRYGGAMDKLSGTWTGIWSNLGDQITKFQKMIGDAGIFEALKGEMQGILKQFEQWESDGTLKAIAKEISDGLISVLKEVSAWIKGGGIRRLIVDLREFFIGVKSAVNMVGGLKNVLMGLGALFLAGPIASIIGIVGALWRFGAGLFSIVGGWAAVGTAIKAVGAAFAFVGRLFLLNPIGLTLTAIAAGVYAVYANFDTLKGWMTSFFEWIGEKVQQLTAWFADLVPDWAKGLMGGGSVTVSQGAAATPLVQSGAVAMAAGRTQFNGSVDINFNNAPPGMRVSPGKADHPGVSINPDVGYRSLAHMVPQ